MASGDRRKGRDTGPGAGPDAGPDAGPGGAPGSTAAEEPEATPGATPLRLAVATEGYLDLALIARLFAATGFRIGEVLWGEGRNTGKGGLGLRLPRYRAATERTGLPLFLLRDLDDDAACAPALLRKLKVETGGLFCLRIAVREAEAWLMADRAALAAYLHVAEAELPADPEALDDPKAALVAAARRSRAPRIRAGFTARPGSGRPEGPDFVPRIERFTRLHWRPELAAAHADSLARALHRLSELRRRLG